MTNDEDPASILYCGSHHRNNLYYCLLKEEGKTRYFQAGMDNLADSFGRLSTSAREWKPGGAGAASSSSSSSRSTLLLGSSSGSNAHSEWQGGVLAAAVAGGVDSELNAVAVKEFVPGKGWSTTTPSSGPQHPGELRYAYGRYLMRKEFQLALFLAAFVKASSRSHLVSCHYKVGRRIIHTPNKATKKKKKKQ